jgi:para-nitrobenzyl esterase
MIVETTSGSVRGFRRDPVSTFRGIPYAEQTRFAAAKPHHGWTGVRDALDPGPAAPQPPTRLARAVGPMRLPGQSEDCLTLTIDTPGVRDARPVLVWVHGGGFFTGSGAQDWYDGARLAARGNLVVVTLNYRLGALGFLRLPGVAEGNLGLSDQVLALRWVRDNIAAFGGDPDRVTLAGQSAGAYSALALSSASAARGLFQRMALQSTPTGMPPQSPDEAAEIGERFRHATGNQDLLTLPAEGILAAQQEIARRQAGPLAIAPPFQLVADDDLVAHDLLGTASKIPALVSWTRHEINAFADPETVPQEEIDQATERLFAQGSRRLAKDLGAAAYRFDWHPAGNPLGACHCIDTPFVFGNLDAWKEAPMLDGATETGALADAVQRTWIAFAHGDDVPDQSLLRRYSS